MSGRHGEGGREGGGAAQQHSMHQPQEADVTAVFLPC